MMFKKFHLIFLILLSGTLMANDLLEDYPRLQERLSRLNEALALSETQTEQITKILLDSEAKLDLERETADSDEAVIRIFHETEITNNEKIHALLNEEQQEKFSAIIQPEIDSDERLDRFRDAVKLTPEQSDLVKNILPKRPNRGEGRRGYGQGQSGGGQGRSARGGRNPERMQKMMAGRQERMARIEQILIPEQQLLFREFEQERMEEMLKRRANRQ